MTHVRFESEQSTLLIDCVRNKYANRKDEIQKSSFFVVYIILQLSHAAQRVNCAQLQEIRIRTVVVRRN